MDIRAVVKVRILGEEYTLRTEASPEHTKAVAEQHGGGIEWCRVESRTRFILRLPSSIVCGAPASPEKLA